MRRRRAITATAGLCLLVAACGHSKAATTNPTASSAAAALTAQIQSAGAKLISAKTARFTKTITVTPQTGDAQTIVATGSADIPNHRVGMSLTLPGLGSIDAVIEGTLLYERIPSLASDLGGKPWLKIDAEALKNLPSGGPFANLLASLGSLVNQAENQDPTSGLSLLDGVTGTVSTVGHETVRGVPTTHYAFQFDLVKAVANLPADARSALDALQSQFGLTSGPADAWLDGDGLVRRIHLTVMPSPTASPSPLFPGASAAPLPKLTELTIEAYDFGSAVTITDPPPDQVADLLAMLSQLGSH